MPPLSIEQLRELVQARLAEVERFAAKCIQDADLLQITADETRAVSAQIRETLEMLSRWEREHDQGDQGDWWKEK